MTDTLALDPPRVEILGVGVSALTREMAVEVVENWIETNARKYICVNTVHSLICAADDPGLRAVYRDAGLVTPDGMPLVWLSRLRGHSEVERVYGPDLMLDCCDRLRSRGARHYFYGGASDVPERLAERLRQRFPGLEVVGAYAPPFRDLSPSEKDEIVGRINDARPDVVWVGLGCPKQDWWMAEFGPRLDVPALVGVGAAFDFHSGRKRQAPRWMQRAGLEWSYRLLSEPRRLARRYIVGNARFVGLVALEELRVRRARA